MASPTAPTLVSLTTEALKRATNSTPSATLLTRAADWMEEVKSDIATVFTDVKSLYKTAYLPTTIGKHRYANPSDFGSQMNLTLMYGLHIGSAQGGAVGSITLASDEDISEDFILGKYVLVTSGTGASSCSQVTAYSTSTKIATVTPNFETAPAASSGYMVVDSYYDLSQEPIWDLDKNLTPTLRGQPTHYLPIGDADDGEFILYPAPDKVYGLQMRYYADLTRLDLASATITTLYRRFRNVWIQGVYVRALEDKSDDRAMNERAKYEYMLQQMKMRERFGADLSNLQMTVSDY